MPTNERVRDQLLALAGKLAVLTEAEGPVAVHFRRGSLSVRFDFTAEELAAVLPPNDPIDELTVDDRAILRILDNASGPMLGKAIAHALGLRRDWSTLRDRFGPRAPLRRLGLIVHDAKEGYSVTDAGRSATGGAITAASGAA